MKPPLTERCEPSTESSCGVGATDDEDSSRAVGMRPRDSVGLPEGDSPSPEGVSRGRAAPIRSKLCVSRSDLRSLFPADRLGDERVKRRFQAPRRGGIAALSRGL